VTENPFDVGDPHHDVWERRAGGESSQTGSPAQSARRLVLTPASTVKLRRVEWLWQDRVPVGEVTMTPGRGGIGKSTHHAWQIAHITRGTLPGIHYGKPKACIVAAAEDSWERTIAPRLVAAGADLDMVYRVDVLTAEGPSGRLSLPADCRLLAEQVKAYEVALISLDPLMSVIHAGVDTYKNHDVRGVMEPLSRLADSTGVVVLGNAHFNKSASTDPLALITGSSAFGEVIRAAVGFARDPEAEDGSCVLSQIKNNLGRTDLPSLRYAIENATVETSDGPADVGRFRLIGESDRSVSEILGDRGDGDDRTERDEAKAWLTGYLIDNGGEAARKDVLKAARAAGFSEATLKRARTKIADADRQGFGGGSVWRLRSHSDHHSARPDHLSEGEPNGPNGPNEEYGA
jgi:hypothetical protein